MKYLEIAALTTLTDLLTACEVGDSVLNGRIEAFSCAFTTFDHTDSRGYSCPNGVASRLPRTRT